MSKYLEVFRLSFKMQIVWRFDVAMTMVAIFGRITAGWIVWGAIFQGKDLVGGFSHQGMISYYLICSLLCSIDFSSQISFELNGLIREGRFSGHMVTPMDPLRYFCSMVAGESAFHLGFSLVAAFICAAAFRARPMIAADPARVMIALAMIVVGLAFMACLQFLVGILTFKYTDIEFVLHAQSSVIGLATGAMLPLSLLPEVALRVLRLLPFPHVIYTPAALLIGQAGIREGVSGLAVLGLWAILTPLVATRAYHRLRMKYDGVGI